MGTIVNFLKINGNKTFKEVPFCDADILTIGLLTYCNFEGSDICEAINMKNRMVNIHLFSTLQTLRNLNIHFLIPKEIDDFYGRFLNCARYKDVKIGYFKKIDDTQLCNQFFGLTIRINHKIFVCVRGTDRTINGWEEDFNLALLDVIPSQESSRIYLEDVLQRVAGQVYVLGHSKAGNLVYYAFLKASPESKERIKMVYNLDGPGFKNFSKDTFKPYLDKLVKIVPNDDVVGILLEPCDDFEIVVSNKTSIFAHDLCTWELSLKSSYRNFTKTNTLTNNSIALRYTLAQFIDQLGPDKVREVGHALFKLIRENNITDAKEFGSNFLFIMARYEHKTRKIKSEQDKDMRSYMNLFAKLYMNALLNLRNVKKDDVSKLITKFSNTGE